ncbi:MAG TPA: saccharopine dehydrogenase NADP-binding domain-containing protein [Acidimicrobiales bacterium]|jgi:hypothetical protein|nr:saccharopine dehydrogenase NADP-binding domain-containing protein [Acidimicrobiales bacterium]
MTSTVGLLGAYGGVGRAAARRLASSRIGRLRVGGRRPGLAQDLLDEVCGGDGESVHVDIADADSLARFCAGCDVVANCAGPSYRILDAVARAAHAAGASYIDAAGDDPVYDLLLASDGRDPAWVGVLSAGMLPGLSGVLPRYLVGLGFDRVGSLTVFAGGRDFFTPGGASDYLASLGNGFGESLAAWCGGAKLSRALTPLRDVELPFFPGPVTAHPYMSTETERLAAALGLQDLSWYNVFEGGHVVRSLGRLQGAMMGESDLDAAARQLARAARLDMFGRTPYQLFVLQLDGERDGLPMTRSLVLRASGANDLTGAVAALAVEAVARGDIPPGVHYASDVLDPGATVDALQHMDAVEVLEVLDGPVDNAPVEEGVL